MDILASGPSTTVQDLGRPGYAALGVGRAGAADRHSLRLANRIVGNLTVYASLETTFGGLSVLIRDACTLAFTGATCTLIAEHDAVVRELPWAAALTVGAGTTMFMRAPESGLRSYLAVRGGFAFEPALGSCSTDTLSRVGPNPLTRGDTLIIATLPVDSLTDVPWSAERRQMPSPDEGTTVRVIAGPRDDWFGAAGLDRLCGQQWSVRSESDRVGIRLAGDPLTRLRSGELPTEPMLPGAVQIPPDGLPVVLGVDAPVTGGYPVIACVIDDDLDMLAQLRPGNGLRFSVV